MTKKRKKRERKENVALTQVIIRVNREAILGKSYVVK